MMFKRLPCALILAFSVCAGAASGQVTSGDTAKPADPEAGAAPTARASLAHSSKKTFTYEIGNTLNNFLFLSAGTGGVVSGGMLTAFNTLQSMTVYTTNDYLWEKYYPRPVPKEGETFDIKESTWRTTLKYMTGKPVVASIKIAAIYVYTGSAAVAVMYGAAATTGASVVFFVNNLAWDYYDQSVVAPAPAPVAVADASLR